MKTVSIILTFLCLASTTFAQISEPEKKKKYKISNAYIAPMGILQKGAGIMETDINKLTENSSLLKKQPLEGFKLYSNGIDFNTCVSINLGITKFNEKENTYVTSPEFRVGITYSSYNIFSANYYKKEIKRIDTLISPATGNIVYYDSITNKNYSFNTTSNQLLLDVSMIFRTNPQARWSMYGGIGVDVGGSINAYTTIRYYKDLNSGYSSPSSTNISEYSSYGYINLYGNQEIEQIKMENQISSGIYLPLGIDFRFGEKKDFFKRIHGFFELRPFLNSTSVPELKTNFMSIGIKGGMGLRVSF